MASSIGIKDIEITDKSTGYPGIQLLVVVVVVVVVLNTDHDYENTSMFETCWNMFWTVSSRPSLFWSVPSRPL